MSYCKGFAERKIAILKVRAKILQAARCWLDQGGYLEVQGPTLVPAVGDWPSYFEVKYFGKKAYLAQGLQPYVDSFVEGFEKIYTVAPSFRAEKAKTMRHLTEYWRIEVAERCGLDELIKVQEELLTYVCRCLAKTTVKELKCLGHSAEDLARIKPPFPRLTYDEAVEILQKDGLDILWGQEINWSLEKQLSMKFNHPFFVTELPEGIETLFYKSHPTKLGSTLTVDLLAPEGYGEMGSGGQAEDDKNVLRKKMAEEKIEAQERRWYLGLRRHEMVPSSGFAIGLERLIQWICKLENISDATAIPRLANSIYP
jgi:asparaginyl-tRNA synthetase